MTPTELTSSGGLALSVVALVVLPLVFRRQTAKQLKAQQTIEEIKERAKHDAAVAVGETVSWEKINRALATTAQEERAAHRERIAELRETFAADAERLREAFAAETERLRRQTAHDLDRARDEINTLTDQVQTLTRQLAALLPSDRK